MDQITQLGIGGIFAVMVIREVLSFLKKGGAHKKPRGSWLDEKSFSDKLLRIDQALDAKHPHSLDAAIRELSHNVASQAKVLDQVANVLSDLREDVGRIEDKTAV